MKDFSRLAVGILMLGLAIFLSLNFGDEQAADNSDNNPATSSENQQPDWQAPPLDVTAFANRPQNESVVIPRFDTSTEVATQPSINDPQIEVPLHEPPRISDQYHPLRPLTISGQFSRESELVPVQPKPSFTGSISYVKQIHTIRDGDTLQTIAREYFGSADRYLDIYLLNKDVLSNPARLPLGVEIRIPGE